MEDRFGIIGVAPQTMPCDAFRMPAALRGIYLLSRPFLSCGGRSRRFPSSPARAALPHYGLSLNVTLLHDDFGGIPDQLACAPGSLLRLRARSGSGLRRASSTGIHRGSDSAS